MKLTKFTESLEFQNLIDNRNPETIALALNKFEIMFELFEKFDSFIKSGHFGALAKFWNSYLEMVQALFDFIKSYRIR